MVTAQPNGLADWLAAVKDFDVTVANGHEAAIELCQQRSFHLAVIDHTDDSIDHRKLAALFPVLQDDMSITNYTGGTHGEVETRIRAFFEKKKMERLKRLLILDATGTNAEHLPPFSVN